MHGLASEHLPHATSRASYHARTWLGYTARVSARPWLFACVAIATSASLGFACSTAEAPVGASGEAGIPDATIADGAWGTTACAACTIAACNLERAECSADPGCALNLDCIEACPAQPDGDPDAACVAACPVAPATASETPRRALERCRLVGRATDCPTCAAAGLRRYRNPLLTNTCESTTWDAGPGATPVQEQCAKCLSQRCCESRDACRADPTCFDLKDCYAACKDTACNDACYAMYDASIAHLFGFVSCATVRCGAECGDQPDACGSCIYGPCADPFIDCRSDHDCYLLSECIAPCKEFACLEVCNAKYPAAVRTFESLTLCTQARCPACRR